MKEAGFQDRLTAYIEEFSKIGELKEWVKSYGSRGFAFKTRTPFSRNLSRDFFERILKKAWVRAHGKPIKIELQTGGILLDPIHNILRMYWSGPNTTVADRTIAIMNNKDIVEGAEMFVANQNNSSFLNTNYSSSWTLLCFLYITVHVWHLTSFR